MLNFSWGSMPPDPPRWRIAPNTVVHLDLVGPLPHSKGYTYLLTCIDRFTRWPAAYSQHYSTVGGWGLHQWMDSALWNTVYYHDRPGTTVWVSTVANVLGSRHIRTTVYHPIANGLMERFHRQLKASLKAYSEPNSWMTTHPGHPYCIQRRYWVHNCRVGVWQYPATPRGVLQSVYECTDARPNHVHNTAQDSYVSIGRHIYVSNKLTTCTHVFVRHDAVWKPLQPPYNSPFLVLK